jgi:mono/diheme cytochrome c family protein
MESRKLMIYLTVILAVLIGMLIFLYFQVRQFSPGNEEGEGGKKVAADLANGGSIYLEGKDLQGRMIPISGGPAWLLKDGGGCVACHGEKGEGGKPIRGLKIVPPNIRKAVARRIGGMSEENFGKLIKWGELRHGKSLSHEMPRFDLTDNEVRDLLAFIRKL